MVLANAPSIFGVLIPLIILCGCNIEDITDPYQKFRVICI